MYCLGIDTSNYTTSVAVANDKEIVLDKRILLKVKPGELGLRQSDALYQHWENLPILLEEALKYDIQKIVVSTRPRPVEGSYMPVFNAGKNIAKVLSDALNLPLVEMSHQEGHILAASYGNDIDFNDSICFAHFSGGTLEIVDKEFNIITCTKDISFGQLIDRTGVFLGLDFPAGKYIDQMALKTKVKNNPLSKICIKENGLNLSGLENQIKSLDMKDEEIAYCLMERISEAIVSIFDSLDYKNVLISGGVASSAFIREYCKENNYFFGRPELCSDNAVGLAVSGGKLAWE